VSNSRECSGDLVQQFYHGPGVVGKLQCHGCRYCTFDLSVAGELIEPAAPRIRLELLWQPVDPATNLPRGGSRRLLQESVDLVYIRRRHKAVGRSWL